MVPKESQTQQKVNKLYGANGRLHSTKEYPSHRPTDASINWAKNQQNLHGQKKTVAKNS